VVPLGEHLLAHLERGEPLAVDESEPRSPVDEVARRQCPLVLDPVPQLDAQGGIRSTASQIRRTTPTFSFDMACAVSRSPP
jgi:hypothetical protein